MSDLFRTPMGQRFYEATMPSLMRELARLNQNLERLLVVERDAKSGPPASEDAKPEEPR